jgi:endoglucanase
MQHPEEHGRRFLALWEQIANHYERYPADLLFELLNEPQDELGPELWNPLLKEAMAVIRDTNPERNIIVGSTDWYSIKTPSRLQLPEEEKHVIVSIHYYSPFQFTHQGAEWIPGSDPWLGTTWQGTSPEKQAIIRDFDLAAAWAERNNRPIYLGEFGAYSKADMASRALWTEFVARQAEEMGMSWAYWEFCAGFGAYDKTVSQWNEQLLEALIPQR